MNVFKINSFVYNQLGGNPAGVVVDLDKHLSDTEMLSIAKEVGFSETAFVSRGTKGADFDVRFFTPVDEVPLCGHATIASFWHLAQCGLLKKERLIQNTGAGLLAIQVTRTTQAGYQVTMAQATPVQIAQNLPFDTAFKEAFPNAPISKTLPIDIWSTGLKDILLPLESREALDTLSIDFAALTKLSQRYDVVGVHAFAVENGAISARNFAPLYGIDEESATGTSNGALTAYLHHYLYPTLEKLDLCILQGEAMGLTSAICTKAILLESGLEIWVGGDCNYIK